MWFADYQQGEGTMYYYNGDVYIGNWFQDKRSGRVLIPGKQEPNMRANGKKTRKRTGRYGMARPVKI